MHLTEWATKAFTAALALLGSQQPYDDIIDHGAFSKDVTQCPGYVLHNPRETRHGLTADLKLGGPACNAYGHDVKSLKLEVEYQTDSRELRSFLTEQVDMKIPEKFWPRPKGHHDAKKSNLRFHHQTHPFAFWITRKDSDEVIFDTRPSSIPKHLTALTTEQGEAIEDSTLPAYPLVFEDQYLQIATHMHSDANIYGLGEVIASSGIRRDTDKGTIATLWNSDGGTPIDKSLYGSHPFYLSTRDKPNSAHGVFLLNSHGMDVVLRPGVLEYRVIGGTLDFYILAGPTPKDVIAQYSEVAGKPAKMPDWSFGFHLCRWDGEWVSIDRMRKVVETMREQKIPMDTIWSDLDYMDRFRDFEPNEAFKEKYGDFLDWIHENGQHYVPIVDAGIGLPKNKSDKYQAYDNGHELDLFIKDHRGEDFVGEVWPGPTVFPDWLNKHAFKWWAQGFDHFRKMVHYDGIWLDMNEPANGIEENDPKNSKWGFPPYRLHTVHKNLGSRTVPASAKQAGNTRHYHSHNLFGYLENMATRLALLRQEPNKRPFMLSRSTFAGQGRISAHWLGDNYSTWKSMYESIQGVLQFNMFQMPMVGADVCGFGDDASEELCNRWMSLGAWFPFYRNHNAKGSSDQEPFRWESVAEASRTAMFWRYKFLPVWESLFSVAHKTGIPPVRPLFFEFDDPKYKGVDTQFMVGSDILITPVLKEGATSVRGYFPKDGAPWRKEPSSEIIETDENDMATFEAPLGQIPIAIRSGGMVLGYKDAQYTVKETKAGPMLVAISLDLNGKSKREFILDDGITVDSPETTVIFNAENRKLTMTTVGDYIPKNKLEIIRVYGCPPDPSVKSAGNATILDEAPILEITDLDISLAPGQKEVELCSW